jgi:predicted esterase
MKPGVARTSLVMLGILLATASCRRETKKSPPPPAPRDELAPLVATAAAAPLVVPGFGDAVVSAPAGATTPAPVLVAVLGIGDTPESQCAVWRELVGQRAFVLCPRGLPHFVPQEPSPIEAPEGTTSSDQSADMAGSEPQADAGKVVQAGFYPSDVASVEREVAAGLGALRARYGRYVAGGPVVYTGFSRGAFLGASVAANSPATFARAVLIEGGQSPWTDATAAAFAKSGGKRILFACGRPSCVTESEQAAAILAKQHVETRIVNGEGEGHGYKKQVKDQLRASFDWVTEGDPLWRQLIAARATGPAPASAPAGQ